MRIVVTARCVAASVFGAMELWMVGNEAGERSLPELARMCRTALEALRSGLA